MRHPLAEIFGFPYNCFSARAEHYRSNRLCPFNNKVPSCTKDKAQDPLGVCSVWEGDRAAITCPIRFREDWIIASDAAQFFFPPGALWTSLTEVRLNDRTHRSAGNIDLVLVSYDPQGKILDFGAVEVQGVYISGNVRDPFKKYMENPRANFNMTWPGRNYPSPDYLSSSRKRLVPQLLYKGGILNHWQRKIAVVLTADFFETLPELPQSSREDAEIAWFLYDLAGSPDADEYHLQRVRTVYTQFKPSLDKIIVPEPGPVEEFIALLQEKLNQKLEFPPDAPTLLDSLGQ